MSDRSIGDDRTSAGGGGELPQRRPVPAAAPVSGGGERSIGDGHTCVPQAPAAEHAPGTVIDGRFEIVGLLGRGG
ncbi:MAG: hypothetical protein ACKO4Q_09525, partial [Planctomycetota bacterium]